MIIKIEQEGSPSFEAIGFFTLENADAVLADMTENKKGKRSSEVSYVPFRTDDDYQQCLEAMEAGNFLAFLQPNGIAKFILKDAAWFDAAEKIVYAFDTDILRDKPLQ